MGCGEPTSGVRRPSFLDHVLSSVRARRPPVARSNRGVTFVFSGDAKSDATRLTTKLDTFELRRFISHYGLSVTVPLGRVKEAIIRDIGDAVTSKT